MKKVSLCFLFIVITSIHHSGAQSAVSSSAVNYTFSTPCTTNCTGCSSAVARTVQAKLNDVYNVKDFGAQGNGAADDTAAIQAAINCAYANGGAGVWMPAGTYVTSATLLILPNVDLHAARNTVTITPKADFDVLRPYSGSCMQGITVNVTSLGLNFTHAAILMNGMDAPYTTNTRMSGFNLVGEFQANQTNGYGIRFVASSAGANPIAYVIAEDFNISGFGTCISLEASTSWINANTFHNFSLQNSFIGISLTGQIGFSSTSGNQFTNFQVEGWAPTNASSRVIQVSGSGNYFEGMVWDYVAPITIEVIAGSDNIFVTPGVEYGAGTVDNGSDNRWIAGTINTNGSIQKNYVTFLDAAAGNLSLGSSAGSVATGSSNTFIGQEAGNAMANGARNTFVGSSTGMKQTTATDNTFIGATAGILNAAGSGNTFVGSQAGYSNTSGNQNTFMGMNTGIANTSGSCNTLLGRGAGGSQTTDNNNTFVGYFAGVMAMGSAQNTFVGSLAGDSTTTGSNNTCLGYNAGNTITTGSNNIVLGSNAVTSTALGNGQVVVGASTNPVITATSATTGSVKVPAEAAGFLTVVLNGQIVKFPFYNN